MIHQTSEQYFDTVVIGGGQAGLAMGYFLARQDRHFVILDAGERIGDTWRNRWDSLRLFTLAFHDGLPGMPFPVPGSYSPPRTKRQTTCRRTRKSSTFPCASAGTSIHCPLTPAATW